MRISTEQAEELEKVLHGFLKGKNYQIPTLKDNDGNVTEWRALTGNVNGERTIEITQGMFLIDPRTMEEVGKEKIKKEKAKNRRNFFKKILKVIING